jgi:hypothetical protein
VRRPLVALLLVASTIGAASVAFAQESTQADAGVPPPPTVTVTQTATPPPPPPPPAPTKDTAEEQEPLRLGRFMQLESDRAHNQRYGSTTLKMIGGAADVGLGIGTFAYTSSYCGSHACSAADQTIFTVVSVFPIVIGGVMIIDGILTLVTPSPMERLLEIYAPTAIDKNMSATQRLARGEALLLLAAESERKNRTVNAVSSFVGAAICVGLGFWTGLDTANFPEPNNALFAFTFAGAGVLQVLAGIGALWYERGAAEIAWEQWHAAHEHVTVETARVHFTPMFAPTRGGATGGLSLRF